MGLRPVGSPGNRGRTSVPAADCDRRLTRPGKRSRLAPMAQPATRPEARDDDAPSLDPSAVERAYHRERARRHARHRAQQRDAQLERALLGRARRAHLPDRRLRADRLARDPDDVRDLTARPKAILGRWWPTRSGPGRDRPPGRGPPARDRPPRRRGARAREHDRGARGRRRGRRGRGGVRRRCRDCCSATTRPGDGAPPRRRARVPARQGDRHPGRHEGARDRAGRRSPACASTGSRRGRCSRRTTRTVVAVVAEEAPDVQAAIGYPEDRYGVGKMPWPGVVVAPAPRPRSRRCACVRRRCSRARRPGVLALHKGLVSAAVVRAVHARGATVLTWTVNDPALVRPLPRRASTRSARTIRAWCSPSSRKACSAARFSARLATLIVAREAPPFHLSRSARPRRCRRRSPPGRSRRPVRRRRCRPAACVARPQDAREAGAEGGHAAAEHPGRRHPRRAPGAHARREARADNGFRIPGEAEGNNLGLAVQIAGDVNADGIDDFLVSAVGHEPAGTTYVVYGHTSAFPVVLDLSSLDGSNGFRIERRCAHLIYIGRSARAGRRRQRRRGRRPDRRRARAHVDGRLLCQVTSYVVFGTARALPRASTSSSSTAATASG